MFERSVGRKPVPYIASSRTRTGGITCVCPCADRAIDREAVEGEREQGRVADQIAEAGAGQPRRPLHLEAADLGVLRPFRCGIADAAELLGVLLGVAVGRRRVGRVRHLLEQAVALRLGGGELVLGRLQLLLDAVQLLELFRRRLALHLELAAQVVDARNELAPPLVGGEQGVEVLGCALARERGPEAVGVVAGRAEVDHATESRYASITWATPSSSQGGQTKSATASTRGWAFSTATP